MVRWTLAMQEYNFQIVYWKGDRNGNTDALSQHSYFEEIPCTITWTVPQYTSEQLQTAQLSVLLLYTGSLHTLNYRIPPGVSLSR